MKLFYFPVYGRAESIRMMLHRLNVEYENVSIDGEKMKAMKEAGELEFGQVPMFELDDGTKLTQSAAIFTYLLNTYGESLKTASPLDEYKAQNLFAFVFDDFIMKKIVPWMAGTVPEEEKAKLVEKFMEEDFPPFLAQLEARIPESGWILGDKMTWIDIQIGSFLHNNVLNAASKRAASWAPAWEKAAVPKTKAYAARFGDEFKEYLASRPPAPI